MCAVLPFAILQVLHCHDFWAASLFTYTLIQLYQSMSQACRNTSTRCTSSCGPHLEGLCHTQCVCPSPGRCSSIRVEKGRPVSVYCFYCLITMWASTGLMQLTTTGLVCRRSFNKCVSMGVNVGNSLHHFSNSTFPERLEDQCLHPCQYIRCATTCQGKVFMGSGALNAPCCRLWGTLRQVIWKIVWNYSTHATIICCKYQCDVGGVLQMQCRNIRSASWNIEHFYCYFNLHQNSWHIKYHGLTTLIEDNVHIYCLGSPADRAESVLLMQAFSRTLKQLNWLTEWPPCSQHSQPVLALACLPPYVMYCACACTCVRVHVCVCDIFYVHVCASPCTRGWLVGMLVYGILPFR